MNTYVEDRINALLTKDKNKLKVYTDLYDSHSLRAHTYWSHKMPDIQLATEDTQCYEVNGLVFTEFDNINYQGTNYTGKEFYGLFNKE